MMQTNLYDLIRKGKQFSRSKRWFETRLLINYCWYIPMIKKGSNEMLSTYNSKTKKTNME